MVSQEESPAGPSSLGLPAEPFQQSLCNSRPTALFLPLLSLPSRPTSIPFWGSTGLHAPAPPRPSLPLSLASGLLPFPPFSSPPASSRFQGQSPGHSTACWEMQSPHPPDSTSPINSKHVQYISHWSSLSFFSASPAHTVIYPLLTPKVSKHSPPTPSKGILESAASTGE